MGHEQMIRMGMQLYRLEQISATSFLIALPVLLHYLAENVMPKVSKAFIALGMVAFSVFTIMAFVYPDSFISITKVHSSALIKEGSSARGQVGLFYYFRDGIAFVNFIYAFIFMRQILKSRVFFNFTRWIYSGLLIAIVFAINDLFNIYFNHLTYLPPILDFSYLVVGLSIFSAFTMMGVFHLFVKALKKRDISLSDIQQMAMVSGIEYYFYEKIFFLSNEFVNIFHIPEEKLVFYEDAFADKYIVEQDKYLFSRAVETARQKKLPSDFTCRIHCNGTAKWARFSKPKLKYDSTGKHLQSMLWSVQDITEQKKAEQTLISFKNAVESSSDAVCMATPKGEIWYQNKASDIMFGKKNPESARNHFVDPVVETHIEDIIKSGGNWHGEVEMYSKSKMVLNILLRAYSFTDSQGEIIGLVRTHTDITANKRFEKELSRLRNYMFDIINSMPSVIIGVDKSLVVTLWNHQAEKQTNIKRENAQGKPVEQVLTKMEVHMDLILGSIQSNQTQTVSRKKSEENKEIIYENITIYPLGKDKVEGAVIRLDNVTDQVRMESMMIQSEKMLSIGGLAAGMAHEINNPLAGMMQNASVLINRLTKDDIPANEEAAKTLGIDMTVIRNYMEKRNVIQQLNHIKNAGSQASKIIQNMLAFAQNDSSGRSLENLCLLLDNAIELAKTDYDLKKEYDFRNIEIIKEYESNLPMVYCEQGQVQQVFFNVLKNGAQAMTEDRLGKDPETWDAQFVLRVMDAADMICIEIEDNGTGILGEDLERIFEPFFTTKNVDKGTGLGLSISYFIITENHNGQMHVESSEGRGTKVIIKFPKS
ncbi:MAG: PAS domain-containing protein [Desulfobacteraceae bacterium]|nr:PAS domain-containing protein [Desulfobacteraceae bacterium]